MARRFTTALSASIERTTQLVLVPAIVGALAGARSGRPARSPFKEVTIGFALCCLFALAIAQGAPLIVDVIAPGFEEERHGLASHLLVILAGLLPLSMATSSAVSVLNAARWFALPELATHLPRVAMILVLMGLTTVRIDVLAWALLVGSALALAVLAVPAAGILADLWRRRSAQPTEGSADEVTGGIGRRLGLTGIAQLQLQGTSWIDAAFASMIGIGALSMLEYAQRLVGLLPSLLSNSLLTVAYTELSATAGDDDQTRFRRNVVWTIRANLFLIVPTAIVLAGTADLLVGIVLQRGAFDDMTAAETTRTIQLMMPGLAINAVMGAVMTAIVADKSLPSFGIVSTAILTALGARIVIFLFVVERFELPGLVLGAAASMALGLATLFALLLRHWKGLFAWRDAAALGGIALSGAAAAAALLGTRILLAEPLETAFAGKAVILVLSSGAGGLAYLAMAALVRLRETELLGDRLFRRRRKAYP